MRPPRIRRLRSLLVLAIFAALFQATSAGAATYCVVKPGCAGTPTTSVQEALDAALSAGSDRIEIGSTAGSSVAGGTYLSGDPLEIQGAGRGVTQLGGPGTVLTLGQGYSSSSVSVSDLTIVAQGSGTALRLGGARAERLDVTGDASATGAVGVELNEGAAFRHGTIALPATNAVALWTRLGTSRVDDVVVDLGSAAGARGMLAENPDGGTHAILDAHHVTVAGGASSQVGAAASAVSSGQTIVLNLRNSILSGVGHAMSRSAPGGSVNVNPTYSNFDPAGNVDAGGVGGITPSPTNTNLNPAFVNAAAHDFRLSSVSPLVDAAQPGDLDAGDPTVDLAGTRRILDGSGDCSPRRDMGAFEVLPGAVTARATAGPAVATVNQRITFDASASCDPDPTAGISAYGWSFDEGGPATGAVVPHSFAKPGVHSATLTVMSSGGRSGSTTVAVTVNAPPRKPRAPRKARRSFVLIQARAVTLSRTGIALIPLRCSGARRCKGRIYLTAARPASQSVGRLIMKVGSTSFAIPRNRSRRVKIRLSQARLALIEELGRLRTIVTVRDRDSAGRPRRSTRTIVLRASRR